MVFKGMLKHGSKDETVPDDAVFMASENVRQNIGDAVKFLKEKLTKSRANFRAFHQMPWYLIIGPENSGKSRLMAKSQLNFLETDKFVQLTPSRANTSGNINWWFTPSAALLDVPGNFLEKTDTLTPSRAAWLELLRQLKRLRPKRPVHGVVLAIDVQTLAQPIENTAKLLRERLQELAHRLNQSFPVYIICTQTDKILGFNEYFDDLGQTEREQHLGITFPLHYNQKNSPTEIFSSTFDKLLQNLHQRSLWRIHHERDLNKRKLIQHFPYQLQNLKENLQRLIYDLSTSSYYIAVRGVYFTSTSAEEKNILDPINNSIEKSFALLPLRHSQPEITHNTPEKSFFIKQLFGERIFTESAVVIDALRAPTSRRDQFLRFAALGAAGVILLSITLFWSHQYQNQKSYLTQTSSALSVYRLLSLAYNPHPVDLTTLVPSLNALSLAHNNSKDASLPWLLRFQLHHEKSISEMTQSLYQKQLQAKLIPAVRSTLAWQLQSENITDSTQLYSLFQAYLMLGDPVHADKQFLTLWFSRDWQNPATRNPEFMGHLDVALQNPLAPQQPNQGLVTQMRANLNALPYGLLAEAILRTKTSPKPIQPVSLLDQHVFIFSPEGVPETFTSSNLNHIDNQINISLAEAIQGNWVLGKKTPANLSPQDITGLKQELINSYTQEYVSAWQNWLNTISLTEINSLTTLNNVLQEFTSAHSPLKQIITAIAKNTNLAGVQTTDPTLASTLQNNLEPKFGAISALSNPTKLNAFLAPLKTLQTDLHQHKSTLDAVNAILSTAKNTPEPFNNWLVTIANANKDLALQTWQQQNFATCHAQMDHHYPFLKTAEGTVSLTAFSAYFAQGGVFSQLYTQTLAPFVDSSQAQWQWKNTSPAFAQNNLAPLAQIERANVIRQLYFNSQNTLAVPFTFTLASHSPEIKKAEILINKKSTDQTSFTWPKDTENFSVVLIDKKNKPHELKETGPWALFKLLDSAQVTASPDNQKFDIVVTVDGYKANYVLTAQPLNPFIPNIITTFECPQFQTR